MDIRDWIDYVDDYPFCPLIIPDDEGGYHYNASDERDSHPLIIAIFLLALLILTYLISV